MPDAGGMKRGFKKLGAGPIPEPKGPDIDHGGKGPTNIGAGKRKKFIKKQTMRGRNTQASKVQRG